jgi:RHS repeat-associated protein
MEPGGAVRFSSTQDTELDGLGRISALRVDGNVLYTLAYDDEGRLRRADFTSGDSITFDYDPVTHARRGHQVDAPAASGGVRWDRDARGLVATETYTQDASQTQRDYSYDGRGALTRSAATNDIATYTYTASGLPDTVSDAVGSRSVHRAGSTLAVGDVTYTWDAAGRVSGKGHWSFRYGASGQISRASQPGRDIDYVYDEADHRLLKRVNGTPVRAEVAGGVLTEGHFVELIAIGDVVTGVLDNGLFTALLTDPRGTPFAGSDGAPGLASPYGARASHLRDAEVIDYARLGWDPDLDIIRMGVRDYDPRLSQFLIPDPLYFENLDKCRESPLQCGLYSYAGSNPISFVDPTGTDTTGMRFILGKEDFDSEKVVNNAKSIGQGIVDVKNGIADGARRAKTLLDDVALKEDLGQFAADLYEDAVGAADAFNRTVDGVFFHPDKLVCPDGDCLRGTTSLLVTTVLPELLEEGAALARDSKPAGGGLPGNALVCRGGTCTAERFADGSGVTLDSQGQLQGVSVNSAPGKTLQELTTMIKNRQVGVSTVEEVRAAGGTITSSPTPNNPFHCTMCGLTPQRAEQPFSPTVRNPNVP